MGACGGGGLRVELLVAPWDPALCTRITSCHRPACALVTPTAQGCRPEASERLMGPLGAWPLPHLWSLGSVIPTSSSIRFQPHLVCSQVSKAAMIPVYTGLCACCSLCLGRSLRPHQTGGASHYVAS